MKTNKDINRITNIIKTQNSSENLLITLAKRLAVIDDRNIHAKKAHMNLFEGITNFSTASIASSFFTSIPPIDILLNPD